MTEPPPPSGPADAQSSGYQPLGEPAAPAPAPWGAPPPPSVGAPPWGAPAPQWSPQPYAWGPPASKGTNGLAIASLVLSLVWVLGLGSILAVVFGIIALRQIKASPQGGKGLAIAGVSIGSVGLLLLTSAIAIPVLLSQRQKGYDADIRSALANAATAEESFFTDNNRYTSSIVELEAEGLRKRSDVVLRAFVAGAAYCVEGYSTRGAGTVWSYRSSGGLVRSACD